MSRARPLRSLSLFIALMPTTLPVFADAPLPLGAFGHDAIHPAWTIEAAQQGYLATALSGNDAQPVFELTEAGRVALWKRLQWPEATAANARCLGNMLDTFCQVGEGAMDHIAVLRQGGSRYFHYDRAHGSEAIHPITR